MLENYALDCPFFNSIAFMYIYLYKYCKTNLSINFSHSQLLLKNS